MKHWWRQEEYALILDHGQVIYEINGVPPTEGGRKVVGWYPVYRYTNPNSETGLFEDEQVEVIKGDLATVKQWCESDVESVL